MDMRIRIEQGINHALSNKAREKTILVHGIQKRGG